MFVLKHIKRCFNMNPVLGSKVLLLSHRIHQYIKRHHDISKSIHTAFHVFHHLTMSSQDEDEFRHRLINNLC